MDIEKLCNVVETELHKIAEKGLSTSNLDTAYKLIDMYKDLKNTEYWDVKIDYYMQEMGGYSYKDGYAPEDRELVHDYPPRHRDAERDEYTLGSAKRGRKKGEHYVRGHYSRSGGYDSDDRYERYLESKNSYRTGKTPECKQRLMATLEDYMDDFSEQMEEMLRDADCQEERETIERYLKKIKGYV